MLGLPGISIKQLPISNSELVDMAAIAFGESSGDYFETFAFCNAIKNQMDALGLTEAEATSGNYSYAKSNNTPPYSVLATASPQTRNGTSMQIAIAGAINAMSGGRDYSNGARGWDGPDVLQGSYNTRLHRHNAPENHYRQRSGGIVEPYNLAPIFYENSRNYMRMRFGAGSEYRAVQPLILNHHVFGQDTYIILATYGASVFYNHR